VNAEHSSLCATAIGAATAGRRAEGRRRDR
jgi:hypothetical protein